jgi:hypothetical protein
MIAAPEARPKRSSQGAAELATMRHLFDQLYTRGVTMQGHAAAEMRARFHAGLNALGKSGVHRKIVAAQA